MYNNLVIMCYSNHFPVLSQVAGPFFSQNPEYPKCMFTSGYAHRGTVSSQFDNCPLSPGAQLERTELSRNSRATLA